MNIYGECYCGDCISFNKCKSDKGTRINLVSEGCSCFEPNDIAKFDYPILPKWFAEHDARLLDKVAEKMKAEVNVCKNCMIVDCDTEYFKPMCEKADKGFIVAEVEEIVDEVIAEMKEEVSE